MQFRRGAFLFAICSSQKMNQPGLEVGVCLNNFSMYFYLDVPELLPAVIERGLGL